MKDDVSHVRQNKKRMAVCDSKEMKPCCGIWCPELWCLLLFFKLPLQLNLLPKKLTAFTFLVQVFIELFREQLGWKPGSGSSCFITVVTAGSAPDVRHLECSRREPHSDAWWRSDAFGDTVEHFFSLIQGRPSDSKDTWGVGEGMKKTEYFYYWGRDKFSLNGPFWNN